MHIPLLILVFPAADVFERDFVAIDLAVADAIDDPGGMARRFNQTDGTKETGPNGF
jgi:hypothetical protein